jgi:hypothetical protein
MLIIDKVKIKHRDDCGEAIQKKDWLGLERHHEAEKME